MVVRVRAISEGWQTRAAWLGCYGTLDTHPVSRQAPGVDLRAFDRPNLAEVAVEVTVTWYANIAFSRRK